MDFSFGERTGALESCSTVQNGIMLIFGGHGEDYLDQISMVAGCRLQRIGSLPTKFNRGACTSRMSDNGREISLLCFPYREKPSEKPMSKECHRYFYHFIVIIWLPAFFSKYEIYIFVEIWTKIFHISEKIYFFFCKLNRNMGVKFAYVLNYSEFKNYILLIFACGKS